jgi:hypothetical protein
MFFRPLCTYKVSAIATRLREKPGHRLSTEHMTSVVGVALQGAATMQMAVNGFRSSGMLPVDHCVSTDGDFAPSIATPIDLR